MAFFFIHNEIDPNVPYNGKEVPRDKKPIVVASPDPNVNYAGKTLPGDKAPLKTFSDPTNTPGNVSFPGIQQNTQLIFGGISLPPDTMVRLNGEKILAMEKILDGVSIIERVSREPYEIEFECVLRMQNINGTNYRNTTPPKGLFGSPNNVFAQEYLRDIWNNIWLPDSVQRIDNTYLNNLGIQQIVIKNISPETVRGSTNIPLKIKGYENVPGQSLIVTA